MKKTKSMESLLINLIKLFNTKIALQLRWKYLTDRLFPYLNESYSILDVGASCGRLSNELSKNLPKSKFVGIDTNLQPDVLIPIKKYDGRHIPYPDNSFDCVMLIDVLHHDAKPEKVLKEAKRVSKKHILIKDHYWENHIDYYLLKYADYIGNKPYDIILPYQFLNISQWQKLIDKTKLSVRRTETFKYNLVDPCKHIIYLFEK